MRYGGRLRSTVSTVAVVLVALAAGLAGSAPAGNRAPLSQLVVSPGPASVTNGNKVALTARLVNRERSMYTKIVFRLPIPAGASFQATTCGSYALVAGELVCEWGDQLPAGETASVVVVLTTPGAGSSMGATGTWSIKEGKPTNTNENFATNPVSVSLLAPGNPLQAAGFATSACTSPSTPTLSTPPIGPGNPLSTSICAPTLPVVPIAGIAASIAERNRTGSDAGITQVSDICLPLPTSDCGPATAPFVFSPFATFTFTIDNKALRVCTSASTAQDGPTTQRGGDCTIPMITKVFHDGVLVPPTSTDPLVESITYSSLTKTTTVVVKASENGKWDFG